MTPTRTKEADNQQRSQQQHSRLLQTWRKLLPRSPILQYHVLKPPTTTESKTTDQISRLSRFLPPLYTGAAVCWESSKHAGDAVCAFNGTGYSVDGEISHIPETTLCGTWDSPLFALGRSCDEAGSLPRMQSGIDAVHASEAPHVKRGVSTLVPSQASLGGRVCSLPYNPWNLGDCVDGAAVTGVPVLQVVISDGAERQRVSSGYGVTSASASRTSSITVVPSAVSGASPAPSGWPVSSRGATATGAVNVGLGRSMVCDGACWSMLLLVLLRVVAHVLLMLGV
ncbi:uncharacterized protein CDV56_108092 [Aspergillus thermomutatus]|uniref:Uncharacterized protein n=1 Tax=Aspergillus thermomutatus TaxID=41047 RepID=A0A397HH04_ASPTH|nr:uncharacterized protein CDV56_108092 [Aspergillus thermomutatus]RHZ60814.1 hypothetical protein CDV56_108092 [Aspergillus thermomutatus]